MNKVFLDSSIVIEFLKINGMEEAKKIMDSIYDKFLLYMPAFILC